MRSGDGCAGRSPRATCSRRRASSWLPSHQSWLASATVSRRRSPGWASASASTSVARAAAVSPAAASASASCDCVASRRVRSSGSSRRTAAWKRAAVAGADACSAPAAAAASSSIARSSPARARVLDVVRALDRARPASLERALPPARARPAASPPARRRRRRAAPPGGGTRTGAAPPSAVPARGRAARRAPRARRRGELGDLVGQLELERVAGDGGGVEQAPGVGAQRRELGPDRGRDGRGTDAAGAAARAPGPRRRAGELLEVERVAAAQRRRAQRRVPDQPARLGLGERLSERRGAARRRTRGASAGGTCPSRAASASRTGAAGGRRISAASASTEAGSAQCTSSRHEHERARSPAARADLAAPGACGGGRPAPARRQRGQDRGQRRRVGRERSARSATCPSSASVEERVRQVGLELRRARLEHQAAVGAGARGARAGATCRCPPRRRRRARRPSARAGRRARRRSPPAHGRARRGARRRFSPTG